MIELKICGKKVEAEKFWTENITDSKRGREYHWKTKIDGKEFHTRGLTMISARKLFEEAIRDYLLSKDGGLEK